MLEVFSLEDILGPPKSSIRMNYEFNFIGKNTRLIGTKSISYPPIKDDLVEKKIVKAEEEEDDWFGWGLNLVIGIAGTAEAVGIQASMWAGASSVFTSVTVPKLVTGLGYGLLGMNTIFEIISDFELCYFIPASWQSKEK